MRRSAPPMLLRPTASPRRRLIEPLSLANPALAMLPQRRRSDRRRETSPLSPR
jgi:hypothetical protein